MAALSLSGKYAQGGADTKNGYELAVSKINEKVGVKVGGKGYRLELRYYDDQSMPARNGELAERLIGQDGVKSMLGPNGLALTKTILPIIEKYKVPMLRADGAVRELFTRDCCYIFAVPSTSDHISFRPSSLPPHLPGLWARARSG